MTPTRRRPSRCPACAYDLKGTTSAACPECGQALDTASLWKIRSRLPGGRAHAVIMAPLAVVAVVGAAAAIGDVVAAFGPRPATSAATVTGMALCLLPVFLAAYWSGHERDTVNGPAAIAWAHGALAVLLGVGGIALGWWVVH